MREELARLQSYQHWPHMHWTRTTVTPRILAATGFYFTGYGDRVSCFECGMEAENWNSQSHPPALHLKWQTNCRFIKNLQCGNVPRGIEPEIIPGVPEKLYPKKLQIHIDPELQIPWRYNVSAETKIAAAEVIYCTSTKLSPSPAEDEYPQIVLRTLKTQIANPLICKVCFISNLNIAFAPCGHAATCQGCATQLKTCCYCRTPITDRIKLFIP